MWQKQNNNLNYLSYTIHLIPHFSTFYIIVLIDFLLLRLNTLKLFYEFIQLQPNCLILAITPANQDIATSDAIMVSRQVDPSGMLAAFGLQSCFNYTDLMHLLSFFMLVCFSLTMHSKYFLFR